MPETPTEGRTATKRPLDHNPVRMRDRRVELGLRQADAAKAAGISAGHLCDLERGRRNPSPVVLKRLAEALNCTTRDLMREAA